MSSVDIKLALASSVSLDSRYVNIEYIRIHIHFEDMGSFKMYTRSNGGIGKG